MNKQLIIILILVIYMLINALVGIYISKISLSNKNNSTEGFLRNYFIGNRSLTGFVLAMTLVATFTSASSFIGGPGIAYEKGLSWVYLSIIQVPTAFIILALLGKKFAIISRRIDSVTISDYIKERYKSSAVVIILSFWIILFSIAQMMAQFIGGAVLLQTITGMPYIIGLSLFGLIVILYTSFGGFRAVVITDTIQGAIMLFGAILFLFVILDKGGGIANIVDKLNVINPNWSSIDSGGTIPKNFILSFWILVGIGTLGLPQTAVRAMSFKNTKSLHNAMIYGTLVLGAMMLLMHLGAVFAPAILPKTELKSLDYMVPTIVLKFFHPIIAGIFIAAPIAAVMSTVSSLLIMTSAAIVKDLYLNYFVKEKNTMTSISRFSIIVTFIIGMIVFLLTIKPPNLIVWINLFALGGMECAFLPSILMGLFWKRANATGALVSSILSPIIYIALKVYDFKLGGFDSIVISIIISCILFWIGSLIGKRTDENTLKIFFND